jgi:L-carnitine CoA-transferase
MSKFSDIPEFGVLSGVRIVLHAQSVAGPFVGTLAADFGADVIWLENHNVPTIDRTGDGLCLAQDRRNMRSLTLDIPGTGRQAFLDLMKTTDIFLQSSKGGQYEKWGLTDEILWEQNPKMIIVHVSGFGQTGEDSYVKRASYDPIAQAFAGMMYANTKPGDPLTVIAPSVADYYTGFMAFGMAMAAYSNAVKTGEGESIDVAQFEVVTRCMQDFLMKDWYYPEGHPARLQPSDYASGTAGYSGYLCSDGKYVLMLIFGPAVMKKAFPIFGIEYGTEKFPPTGRYVLGTPEGDGLHEAIVTYCAQHPAAEVEATLAAQGIPAICMMTPEDVFKHPQYAARDDIVKLEKADGSGEVWGCGIVPKLKKNPGRVWRAAPLWGADNDDVLADIGYTSEQIAALYAAGAMHTPA